MSKRNIVLFVLGAIIFLLVGFFATRDGTILQENSSEVATGTNTADVGGADFSSFLDMELLALDGETVKLGDYSGQPLVLNSWAVWCPFCKKELSEFAEIQAKEPDVLFIAINRSESVSKIATYLSENNLSEQLLFLRDPNDKFYNAIGGFSMPETLFFNRKGELVEHKRGPLDAIQTQERVDKIK